MRLSTLIWYNGYRFVLGRNWESSDRNSLANKFSDFVSAGAFLPENQAKIIRLPRRKLSARTP